MVWSKAFDFCIEVGFYVRYQGLTSLSSLWPFSGCKMRDLVPNFRSLLALPALVGIKVGSKFSADCVDKFVHTGQSLVFGGFWCTQTKSRAKSHQHDLFWG